MVEQKCATTLHSNTILPFLSDIIHPRCAAVCEENNSKSDLNLLKISDVGLDEL